MWFFCIQNGLKPTNCHPVCDHNRCPNGWTKQNKNLIYLMSIQLSADSVLWFNFHWIAVLCNYLHEIPINYRKREPIGWGYGQKFALSRPKSLNSLTNRLINNELLFSIWYWDKGSSHHDHQKSKIVIQNRQNVI